MSPFSFLFRGFFPGLNNNAAQMIDLVLNDLRIYRSFSQKASIFLSFSALAFVFGSISINSASRSSIPIAAFSLPKAFSAPDPL